MQREALKALRPDFMLISHSHQFAFIHIPKAAGASVTHSLAQYGERADQHWMNRSLNAIGIHVNHYAPHRLKRFRLRTSAQTLQQQLTASVFAGLFKFAFVRNPWDLLTSYYHYITQPGDHHRGQATRNLKSFEDYVGYEIHRNKISQSRMVTDRRGELLVDFIGRFETLRDDFSFVCQRLNLSASLLHKNLSIHRDYRDSYTDHLAKRVRQHFAEDIQRFGYTFEESVPSPYAKPQMPARRAA